MSKKIITAKKYVELINDKIKEHDSYNGKMMVTLNSDSSEKPLGIHIIGEGDVRGIVSWATNQIEKIYKVDV